MEKLLTISVAAYNVEPYLVKLLDSVTASKYLDRLEVLIINGGSTDKTAEIAESYEQRFPVSVRQIKKDNVGFGSTLHRGISEAKGKYFRSLDGDDWINTKSLDDLVCKLDEIDADLILSDFVMYYSDGTVITKTAPDLESGKIYSFDKIYENAKWMRYHAIIFKTSVLKDHHITLDEKCYYVDLEYDMYPLPYVNSIYYFKEPIYCYRAGINGQSISDSGRKNNITHMLTVSESLFRFYSQTKAELSDSKKKYVAGRIAEFCAWYIQSVLYLFDFSVKNKQKIIAFDHFVKEQSEEVYLEMEDNFDFAGNIVLLRRSNYFAYWTLKLRKNIRHFLKQLLNRVFLHPVFTKTKQKGKGR